MQGKLIVIDGSDGSGKETQTGKLFERLKEDGRKVLAVQYPNYKSPSSALVKMYLNGEFGNNPVDVNAYTASTFYAVDRFASYKKEWENFYKEGGIILADRYTTSNMVHQAAKMQSKEDKDKFLDWAWNLEFDLMGLPVPNCVFFLDMPTEYSQKLLKFRNNKITGEKTKDIHESSEEFLIKSYQNALYIAEKYHWERISCIQEDNIKDMNLIHEEIYEKVIKIL